MAWLVSMRTDSSWSAWRRWASSTLPTAASSAPALTCDYL